MNTADRLVLSIALCVAGILFCLNAVRSNGVIPQMCEEVAHELNNAYIEGYISREDAIEMIDHCLELSEL